MQYSDAGVAPATTTFRRGPRASTLADEDMDDPTSICSIGMQLLQPESEDIEEEYFRSYMII